MGFLFGWLFFSAQIGFLEFLSSKAEGIVALLALAFGIWQSFALTNEKKLLNEPALISFSGYHDTNVHTEDPTNSPHMYTENIIIKNVGLGPAKIINFKFIYQNETFSTGDKRILEENIKRVIRGSNLLLHETSVGSFKSGQITAAGEETTILRLCFIYNSNEEKCRAKLIFNHMDVHIDYESFYGQHKKFEHQKYQNLTK